MKITEIISEMQMVGRVHPGVSTIDRTAPWVKKGMDQAAKLTQAINGIEDPAEKFKYITGLQSKTSKPQVLADVNGKQRPMVVKHYDPETGEIVLSVGPNNLTTYKTNASSLQYIGRERTLSNVKLYKFTTTDLSNTEVRPSTNKLVLKRQAEEEAAAARIKAERERHKASRDQYWDDNDDNNGYDEYDSYR